MKKDNSIGALYELSGVHSGVHEVGRRKHRSKAEKKERRRKVFKKLAKVGLAPSRIAFMGLVRINALKLATKLSRVWKKDPTKIKEFWDKFGGDFNKLRDDIAKGSHESLSGGRSKGVYMGIAVEAAIASAVPIIVALMPLIKSMSAHGDKQEQDELEQGIADGKKTLADNPDIAKTTAETDQDFESGKIVKKGSEETSQGSFVSVMGICFKLPFLIMFLNLTKGSLLFSIASIVNLYCVIGIIILPFYLKDKCKWYFDVPVKLFYKILNPLKKISFKKKLQ